MPSSAKGVGYRLTLAQGFLKEANDDHGLGRWRSCVDNSQLATENAAKAALEVLGPIGHTHNPAPLLRRALQRGDYPAALESLVRKLAECAELLGPDVHVQSDYGDELAGQTPWDLFDRSAADESLALAQEAVQLASDIVSA